MLRPSNCTEIIEKNGELKYCPFCGKALSEGCDCHKNLIVDMKKKRETINETVMIFDNNKEFQADYAEVVAELKQKDSEQEQIVID